MKTLLTNNERADLIAAEMDAARVRTLALFDIVREEHLHESPGFGFRPVIWHLAHIGVFEAYWLLQKLNGEPAPDERYERIFDPIATPREESKNLPTRREMEDYLARVRTRVLERLAKNDFDSSDPFVRDGYAFRLVIEHERQHQETLAYLLQLIDPSKKMRPRATASDLSQTEAARELNDERLALQLSKDEMVEVSAGSFRMGCVWDSFAYDNELPAHEITLPAFKIDRLPTTNAAFAEFVEDGGYERREFWSDDGWSWRERERWQHPLFWRREGARWIERTMFDVGALRPRHPVVGVCWYEAEAYARYRGKRLPTEAEWEKAASWDALGERKNRFAWGDAEPTHKLCNFDLTNWQTTPAGSFPAAESPVGCLDMTGNVWEWTASAFEGFSGFAPFPYPEYSQTWFDGDHRILKGGSWATGPSVLRTSFRNFFRRHFRIGFAGIRLAADA